MKTPSADILHRALFVLHRGLSDLRYLAKDGKTEQAHDLADALENIPGFLTNWEEQHFEQIKNQLKLYQTKYSQVSWCDYAKYLEEAPPPDRF